MTSERLDSIRDNLAEAHRAIIAARRTSNDFGLLDAVHRLGVVCAELVDLCVDLNDRLPMSTAAFGEILGGK